MKGDSKRAVCIGRRNKQIQSVNKRLEKIYIIKTITFNDELCTFANGYQSFFYFLNTEVRLETQSLQRELAHLRRFLKRKKLLKPAHLVSFVRTFVT